MIRKNFYVVLFMCLMSCASHKKFDREPTRKEIEKDFQKAYKDNKNKPPIKKELTTVTLIAILINIIVLHFVDLE